jgi:hypothetical protein
VGAAMSLPSSNHVPNRGGASRVCRSMVPASASACAVPGGGFTPLGHGDDAALIAAVESKARGAEPAKCHC